MRAPMRCGLQVLSVFLLMLMPAGAAEPSFADLLARAEAQAAAGHRWDPPGDNFAETVVTLFGRLPTATPEQIAEFSALVERDQKAMREQPDQPAPAATAQDLPAPSTTPPKVALVAPTAPAPFAGSAPAPAPAPAPVETQSPVRPLPARVIPDARSADLYGRGQAAEKRGDISGARRFYTAAAQLGHAAAARSLGRLYDPAYVHQNAIGGIDADPAAARHWYERANDLGDPEAGPLLQALSVR